MYRQPRRGGFLGPVLDQNIYNKVYRSPKALAWKRILMETYNDPSVLPNMPKNTYAGRERMKYAMKIASPRYRAYAQSQGWELKEPKKRMNKEQRIINKAQKMAATRANRRIKYAAKKYGQVNGLFGQAGQFPNPAQGYQVLQ